MSLPRALRARDHGVHRPRGARRRRARAARRGGARRPPPRSRERGGVPAAEAAARARRRSWWSPGAGAPPSTPPRSAPAPTTSSRSRSRASRSSRPCSASRASPCRAASPRVTMVAAVRILPRERRGVGHRAQPLARRDVRRVRSRRSPRTRSSISSSTCRAPTGRSARPRRSSGRAPRTAQRPGFGVRFLSLDALAARSLDEYVHEWAHPDALAFEPPRSCDRRPRLKRDERRRGSPAGARVFGPVRPTGRACRPRARARARPTYRSSGSASGDRRAPRAGRARPA